MFDKIIAHTSFIGETGYANHSREFFTALNKIIPVKVRNFTVGKSWNGLNNGRPHDGEQYLTEEQKGMLYKQTCINNNIRKDFYIYGGNKEVEKGNNLHIVLNEVNHYYFYDEYNGPKIAYNVWESTLYPEDFYNQLLKFDQLWVPTQWQKDCIIKQGYPSDRINIVPEAVDSNIFFPEYVDKLDEYKDNRFKFLLFGRWEYRKSTTEIIQTFLKTFSKEEPIDLIASIDNSFSINGIKSTKERLKKYNFIDDRIKIKHFPSREDYIKYLKTGNVFLSCARGEGWNIPLIESMACGTPSIYSNWGGQLEFAEGLGVAVDILNESTANIGKGLGFNGDITGNYCEPNFEDLSKKMRDAYNNYKENKEKAIVESKIIRENFTWENAAKKAVNNVLEIKKDMIVVDSIFNKDLKMEIYQDQYVNGKIIKKGIRNCESRYNVIKKVFEQYNRPFTILDIGANFGYYSIRACSEFNAISIMVEGEKNECEKLVEICDKNNCKDSLIVLNKRISLEELTELSKCEHFDVVLALNVIHHFDNKKIEEVCNIFTKLGDNLIIETPPSGDKNACGKNNLDFINNYFNNKDKEILGSFNRHTCDKKSDINWLKTPKDKLTSIYFGYDKFYQNIGIKDVNTILEEQVSNINSDYETKTIYSNKKNELKKWKTGINLKTYMELNGIYPYREILIDKIKNRDIETDYKWDNSNNDIVIHNFILDGSKLNLIDYDDKYIEKNNLSDKEQLDKILKDSFKKELNTIIVENKDKLHNTLNTVISARFKEYSPNEHPTVWFSSYNSKYNNEKCTIVIREMNTGLRFYSSSQYIKEGVEYYISAGAIFQHIGGVIFEIVNSVGDIIFRKEKKYNDNFKIKVNGEKTNVESSYDDGWYTYYEVFLQESYKSEFCQVEEGDICLDIGANIGLFGLYAVGKKAKEVHCVEPVHSTYSLLKNNTSNFKNISTYNIGLGKNNELTKVAVLDKTSSNSTIYPDKFKENCCKDNLEEVNIVNINDFLKSNNISHIDFLKIDCEGAEYDIFEAIDEKYLKNNIKKIIAEYHFNYNNELRPLLDKLDKCGFEYTFKETSKEYKVGMLYAVKSKKIIKNKDNQKILHNRARRDTKDIIIVNAYVDSLEKEQILLKCILSLKSTGKEILLTSHSPIKLEIQKLVDYYLYDSYNPLFCSNESDYYWYVNSHVEFQTRNFKIGSHSLAALLSLQNAVRFAKSIGKNIFYHIEYDNIIDSRDIDVFDSIRNRIKCENKEGYIEVYSQGNSVVETNSVSMIFSVFNIDFFLSKINISRKKEEYIKDSKNIMSELYLFDKFKESFDNLIIEKREKGIKAFINSSKSLCDSSSNVSHHIDIVPLYGDRSRLYLFVSNESDKKIISYDIFIDEKKEKCTLNSKESFYKEVSYFNNVIVKNNNIEVFKCSDVKCFSKGRSECEYIKIKEIKNKYFICIDSKSLGDNIAWMPYAEEFRKKHNCKVVLSTFWNNLFEKEYPEIEFVGRGVRIDNINKLYNIGWYEPWDSNKNPNNPKTIPLQQTASDILGLDYKEIKPNITIKNKTRRIKEKYICIGIHSTAQAKYWNCPNGWQEVVDYLISIGYKVFNISKEGGSYMGNNSPIGIINLPGMKIEDTINMLYNSDIFIGIGSGLSWLSWAVGIPTILISGFSNPMCEPQNSIERIFNSDVCNSCFNDPNIKFDKGDWNWCPRNKNFECSKNITPDMVINSVNKIIEEKGR